MTTTKVYQTVPSVYELLVRILCCVWVGPFGAKVKDKDFLLGPWYTTSQQLCPWFAQVIKLCFVMVMFWLMKPIFVLQGCFTVTGAIIWLPQWQWSNPEEYGCVIYKNPPYYTKNYDRIKTRHNANNMHVLWYTLDAFSLSLIECYTHGEHFMMYSVVIMFTNSVDYSVSHSKTFVVTDVMFEWCRWFCMPVTLIKSPSWNLSFSKCIFCSENE